MSAEKSEEKRDPSTCPICGTQLIVGKLKGPVDTIHIESQKSLDQSLLQALICLACGHVELHASNPEKLDREDITKEDLDCI